MMGTSGLQAFATHRGLALQGPGGVILLTNHQLAAVAEFAIAVQDLLQPDAAQEPNGDELDGSRHAEDEFGICGSGFDGPGCPVADPVFGAEEAGEPQGGRVMPGSNKAARPNVHAGPSRQAIWQAQNPKARWAHIALASALRRKIITREPCVVCGTTKVDGHHPDYDRPAHVVWLCRRHPNALHRQERDQ